MKRMKKQKQYDYNLFKSKKVIRFIERFDDFCQESFESVFTEFKNHADPIIATADMQAFIDKDTFKVVFAAAGADAAKMVEKILDREDSQDEEAEKVARAAIAGRKLPSGRSIGAQQNSPRDEARGVRAGLFHSNHSRVPCEAF